MCNALLVSLLLVHVTIQSVTMSIFYHTLRDVGLLPLTQVLSFQGASCFSRIQEILVRY